jgi:HAD superfamily hydrolase (TIGR01509 family)
MMGLKVSIIRRRTPNELRIYPTMQHVTSDSIDFGDFEPWPEVDLVLLDMDGTLLDLRFDNYFWREAVPERYAQRHRMSLQDAQQVLTPRFAAKQGTLDWYCTDYWSRELALDIAGLKHELREIVRFLPGAERFLRALRASGLPAVLVTNAHPDALRVKARQTGLLDYLSGAVSSHQYGVPKEHPEFWFKLEGDLAFDRGRTLFVDDSLAVLRAARRHGLTYIVAIAHPDSTLERRVIDEFPSVHAVAELLSLTTLPCLS